MTTCYIVMTGDRYADRPTDEVLADMPEFSAPRNYVDAGKIARYIADAKQNWIDGLIDNPCYAKLLNGSFTIYGEYRLHVSSAFSAQPSDTSGVAYEFSEALLKELASVTDDIFVITTPVIFEMIKCTIRDSQLCVEHNDAYMRLLSAKSEIITPTPREVKLAKALFSWPISNDSTKIPERTVSRIAVRHGLMPAALLVAADVYDGGTKRNDPEAMAVLGSPGSDF